MLLCVRFWQADRIIRCKRRVGQGRQWFGQGGDLSFQGCVARLKNSPQIRQLRLNLAGIVGNVEGSGAQVCHHELEIGRGCEVRVWRRCAQEQTNIVVGLGGHEQSSVEFTHEGVMALGQ